MANSLKKNGKTFISVFFVYLTFMYHFHVEFGKFSCPSMPAVIHTWSVRHNAHCGCSSTHWAHYWEWSLTYLIPYFFFFSLDDFEKPPSRPRSPSSHTPEAYAFDWFDILSRVLKIYTFIWPSSIAKTISESLASPPYNSTRFWYPKL